MVSMPFPGIAQINFAQDGASCLYAMDRRMDSAGNDAMSCSVFATCGSAAHVILILHAPSLQPLFRSSIRQLAAVNITDNLD